MKLHPNEYSQELHYIQLWLNWLIDVLEVAMYLMRHLIKSVFQKNTEDLNVHVSNITGINESNILTKHVSCECNLMVENVIQIKSVITINVGVSVKNIIYVKKIFGTLLHVLAKMVNIYQETKTVTRNFHEKYIISGL